MIETYDGKCGIIATFASSGNQIRCHYEMGHHGPCSFEKYRKQFYICGGTFVRPDPERGFVDSVVNHNQKINIVIVNDDGDIVKR